MRSAIGVGGARVGGGVGRPDVGADVISGVGMEGDSETTSDAFISYVLVGGEDGSRDAGASSKMMSSSSSAATGKPGSCVRDHPPTQNGILCIRSAIGMKDKASRDFQTCIWSKQTRCQSLEQIKGKTRVK